MDQGIGTDHEQGGEAPWCGLTPSGLFPVGPPRPTYREPHPVHLVAALSGFAGATGWLTLFPLLATDLAGGLRWLLAAVVLAALVAGVLTRYGDRGVAVGVAVATGLAGSVAIGVAWLGWAVTGDWPLW
ncbi:MAG TPA: hypothetical protein VKZ67_14380 [Natronosporangium sp.]|nr:hypothetical protein [Natronosporangium sp.]